MALTTRWRRGWKTLYTLAVCWSLCAFINLHVAQVYSTPSNSMYPTLHIGDVHLVQRWDYHPHIGDIVAFHQPPHWDVRPYPRYGLERLWHEAITASRVIEPDNAYIKRIVGLPGDVIECRTPGGALFRNGHQVNEPYVFHGIGCDDSYRITVPAHSVWVLGDNRSDSADSAYWDRGHGGAWGAVPFDDLRGRVTWQIWH